ncbi:protease SohB [Providencia stuartii]|uniref:Protease SohB n=2 Tax=Providencia stuartii TaxID=588 RepID=A0AAJ1JDB6_PROST|nr:MULTISPECIES: protease SohB [Providencia]AXO17408.1 protease SohB [Providencia stuartii]EDU59534.1 putative signal peptide peptidase SppA, 36K type [Providencia stuartii ATCC 25827]EMA3639814.1 protease SohB [Providencia stuartii]MBN5591453.1 protease SohB [Providencia stuartii]MBS7781961.1 protease SohB [Providencia thailandensis]
MEYFSLYGLFLAKVVTIVVAIIALAVFVFGVGMRRQGGRGELKITDLGERYRERQRQMQQVKMNDSEHKAWVKAFKKQQKAKAKSEKAGAKAGQSTVKKPCLYVLDFKGSMDAREVGSLREEISAILAVAEQDDEVLLRLESPGGMVHGYGLAASQLSRLKEKNIPLTIAVDKVAASGGYMMACIASKIVAAPFAIIGSIGVVAQVPNIHRLLKKHDVDVELHTAGEYKRTLTMLGENTEQGRKKFIEDLNETHELFKQFVHHNRPSLDIDAVATGEYWYGTQALDKGLIDQIGVSDDIIISAIETKEIISIRYTQGKKMLERFTGSMSENIDKLLLRWWQRGQKPFM